MQKSALAERREQGSTRRDILQLLRRRGQMTATELSAELGIGAVGIRQHLSLLERDNLVHTVGLRRGVGRPSYLYALTHTAEALFPRSYDLLLVDVLDFLNDTAGPAAITQLFERRRSKQFEQLSIRMQGKSPEERVQELATIMNEQGYMCEVEELEDGSYLLTEHNCPIDCVARMHPQACHAEQNLYQDLLEMRVQREGTIATGDLCCRYRIIPG